MPTRYEWTVGRSWRFATSKDVRRVIITRVARAAGAVFAFVVAHIAVAWWVAEPEGQLQALLPFSAEGGVALILSWQSHSLKKRLSGAIAKQEATHCPRCDYECGVIENGMVVCPECAEGRL